MTDSPDRPPLTDAGSSAGDSTPDARSRAWLAFWREKLSSPRLAWRTFNDFSDELRRDPSFWPHVMAMRGGVVMAAFGVAIALAYAMTLPFALAATVVTAAGVLAGVTTIGLVAGARFAWTHIRRAFHTVKNGDETPMPEKPPRELPAWLEKMGENKIIQNIGESRAWKRAGAFINSQKKWMLGGTAIGGSALTAGMGVWMLMAQAVVLPVVILGTAVSVAALWAVGSIVTGCVGLYFGVSSLLRWHRESKAARATALQQAQAPVVAPAETPAPAMPAPCRDGFAAAQTVKDTPVGPETPDTGKKNSPPPLRGDKV